MNAPDFYDAKTIFLVSAHRNNYMEEQGRLRAFHEDANRWTDYWHGSFLMSKDTVPLAAHLLKARLTAWNAKLCVC